MYPPRLHPITGTAFLPWHRRGRDMHLLPDIDRLVWLVMGLCSLIFAGLFIMIAVDLLWPPRAGPKNK